MRGREWTVPERDGVLLWRLQERSLRWGQRPPVLHPLLGGGRRQYDLYRQATIKISIRTLVCGLCFPLRTEIPQTRHVRYNLSARVCTGSINILKISKSESCMSEYYT